jgi:hypothetical protein
LTRISPEIATAGVQKGIADLTAGPIIKKKLIEGISPITNILKSSNLDEGLASQGATPEDIEAYKKIYGEKGSLGNAIDTAIGIAKSIPSTLLEGKKAFIDPVRNIILGEEGTARLESEIKPFQERVEEFIKPSGEAQETGKVIGDIAQWFIPGFEAAKEASTLAKIGTGAVKGILLGGAQSGSATSAEALLGAGIGAAAPIAAKGISKILDAKQLIKKALGLTSTQIVQLDKIAKTVTIKGKPVYEDVGQWALNKGFKGSREEMIDKAANLWDEATNLKVDIVKAVKEVTPNNFSELTDYLMQKYSVPGQKKALAEITSLAKKTELTAEELEKIRYYADKSLPKGAYKGAEPISTEGIENLIDPIRNRLEILDSSGKMKAANTDIRLLYKLVGNDTGFLNKAAQRAGIAATAKGIGTAMATGVGYAIHPALGKAIGMLGGIDTFLQALPQVSSTLAQNLKNIPVEKSAAFLQDFIKGALNSANATTNSMSKNK